MNSDEDDGRKKIRVQIDRVREQILDAKRRLRGREYVHQKQVTAKDRLLKDLNEELKTLEEKLANE